MTAAESFNYAPTYAPMVPACKAHGIGRSQAFELAASGLLSTFLIGNRRFVYLASLESLPQRLAAPQDDQGGAK
jgi:hypothetical protein